MKTRSLVRAAMVAALYVVLTLLFQPISFGAVQFRISEALTLLPVMTLDAVPGLFIGCLLANLLGGAMWFDIVFGSIATLIAAYLTYRTRKALPLAAAWPVILNGIITGPVVYFGYEHLAGTPVILGGLITTMGSVAFGELVVCYVLGLLLIVALKKTPSKLWND